MNRGELDILTWLAGEQRPVAHLVAMPFNELIGWVRLHGGKLSHQDAAVSLRNALKLRIEVTIQDAGLASGNVINVLDLRARRRRA